MANIPAEVDTSQTRWQASQVYATAGVCLVIGVLLGYLFRGSESTRAIANAAASVTTQPALAPGVPQAQAQMPTLEQMKHMADKKAEPLLAKLKTHPDDANLLAQLGGMYSATHQFKEAADYYAKSLQIDPRNVGVRTKMASCLYFEGDVDGAIAELDRSLKYDPKHAGTLFNLGMIKWKGKGDGAGAVAAWQELLAQYPVLPSDLPSRETIEKLVAEAKGHPSI
ncbi:MAG: tetratricopeptide repeat protein [Acidobacteriia bacterium]|nr:tetratricopeptide repeat protein [Terriglobia bacterium]